MLITAALSSHPSGGQPDPTGYLLPVHTAVAGRARFKVNALYRTARLKSQVEARLLRLEIIHRAQTNILTGSLLVYFDSTVPVADVIKAIEAELAALNLPRIPRRDRTQARPTQARPAAARPLRVQPWHALSPEEVLAQIESSEVGLSSAVAAERLSTVGVNALPKPERRSDLSLLLEQFATPPVAMLAASAAVSIVTGGVLDAAAIVSVVLINAGIGFVTERQSEKTIAALISTAPQTVAVVRDGELRQVPVEMLVPGDIIVFTPGSYAAADARLLSTERLSLDESALTGESMPVEKNAAALCPEQLPLGDRANMVHMGTLVTGGSGTAVVVGTGLNTEIGAIQSLAERAKPPETLVERQLDVLGGQLAWLSGGICAAVFGVGMLRGYGWSEMLKVSISLAVAAVPEGLPTVATTTLAIGIREMRKRNVIVRRLDAVETLGAVQVFCLDKTGTLTLNRMTVVDLHVGMQRFAVNEQDFSAVTGEVEPLRQEETQRLLEVVALCSEVELEQEERGDLQMTGSATETALVELAIKGGLDVGRLRRTHPRLSTLHRAEDRPYMVTVHPIGANQKLIAVKGNPEQLLELCRWYQQDGKRRTLNAEARAAVLRDNERMAGEALRVLGVAYAVKKNAGEPLKNLVWLGLVGMVDPLRPGMTALLDRFHRAGIDTAIITGDQSATAYAVAKQLDLADGRPMEILDAVALDKLDPALLTGIIQRVQVFSRVSPTHKLEIVQALQRAGKIVAMTGDGINDGPALKAADMGVAMGGGGTDVARSVADIVLEDDNLDTMVVAIRDGRTIYSNIRKAIHFLLSTNLSEIEVMLAGVGLGLGQLLNPMQLLWINLITDIFPSLALAMEQPEPDILERPPRDPKEPIIAMRDLRRLGRESAVISASALAAYGLARLRYGPGQKANTHAFLSLTLGELLHALSCRSEDHSLFDRDRLPSNRYLDLALGASLIAQSLTVLVPGLRRILGTAPLNLTDGLVIAAGAVLPLLVNESIKKTTADSRQPSEAKENKP